MSLISPMLLLSMLPKLHFSRIDRPQSRRQGILPLGLESKRHPIRSVLIHSAEYATSSVFNVFTNVSPLGSVEIFNKLLILPEINANHKNQNQGLPAHVVVFIFFSVSNLHFATVIKVVLIKHGNLIFILRSQKHTEFLIFRST